MTDVSEQLQAGLGVTYTIERDLGGGGMSHVFVALDRSLGRRVVVIGGGHNGLIHAAYLQKAGKKVLVLERRHVLTGAVNKQRFDQEIRLAASLQHPHIVPLLTAGDADGLPFFTMPFVEGESLSQRIERTGALPVSQVIRILRDVASALAYAHQHGVVHRDIKPANILLSGDAAVVTDFGVAKAIRDSAVAHTALTSLGLLLGTPTYMAPEQAAGDPTVDHRADIYSLGVTVYEMLAGSAPFAGRSVQAMLSAHMTEPPEPVWNRRSDLPPVLCALVMRCLAKERTDRPQSAAEIVRVSDEILNPSMEVLAESERYLAPLRPPRRRRRVTQWLGAALGAVLLAGAAWWGLRARAVASVDAATEATGQSTSIAVLPFAGGGDSTDEYFRDGMTDQLIVTLNEVPGLVVASRTSSFSFKNRQDVTSAAIGRILHVDNLLEGSIRRDGDRLRVFVQLTNAADGRGLWSDKFDAKRADLFAVQDSISRVILDRLRVRLSGDAPRQLSHPGTANLAAYDLYLRARHQFNRFDEPSLRESIRLYDQALALDPRYAQAWAGIAESWIFLADDYVAPRIAYPAAKKAAEQALAFDSTLAAAHAALGIALYQYEWRLGPGRNEVNAALAIDPHSFLAQLALHGLLIANDKPDSALKVLETARDHDPLSVLNALLLGRFYGIVGRSEESIGEYQRAMQLAPPLAPVALIAIGEARLAERRRAEADSILGAARRMLGPDMDFMLASAEAARGNRAEALRLVAKLEALSRRTYVRPELIAAVYVNLGDRDKAFEWLKQAYEERSPYLLALKVDQKWDPIRQDPRFRALVAKIGLP